MSDAATATGAMRVGNDTRYYITVVEPVMLTEPVRQARAWLWRPEIQVQRYACEEEQRID